VTQKWIVSKPIRILRINGSDSFNLTGELQSLSQSYDGGIAKFHGEVNFGLFRGLKILNYGFGNRVSEFTANSESNPINFALWITTISSIALSILFAFIGAISALINFAKAPRKCLIGPLSLIVWNASIALLLLTTLIYWMVEYFSRLQRNVLTQDEIYNGWTSDGRSQFGFSYHLMAIALVISLLITLSDLEFDYINPRQCCSNLNNMVVPEIMAFGVLIFLHLVTMSWLLLLINVPMLAWICYKYYTIPRGHLGLYDPVEIYNRKNMSRFTRQHLIKMVFHIGHFVIYMYMMIYSIITM
ncbi:Protein cornichon-like 4, partial [Fragariocoptes setiger]